MIKDEIIEAFRRLSAQEKEQAIASMELIWEGSGGLMRELSIQADQQRPKGMACPHCNSEKTIKRGSNANSLKYTCKTCGKHFTSTHGSALYRIQLRDKWQPYLKLMEQGASIRRAAKELGISIQTSFDWRHKILSALQASLPQQLSGVVECDELQLAESRKGSRDITRKPRKRGTDARNHDASKVMVVTAVSRSGGCVAAVVAGKKLSKQDAIQALDGKLKEDTLLITDECTAYRSVARHQPKITHKTISSKKNKTTRPTDKIHLQTVNNQHKQIRDFLAPFNGVSTKYLANYLNWHFYKQSQKDNFHKVKTALWLTITQLTALNWLEKIINYEILIRT
jgi:transposase-like protein